MERYDRGLAKIRESFGPHGDAVLDSMADVAPDLARYIAEFAYGDIHSRPGLDSQQRSLVTIGVLSGLGSSETELTAHVNAALNLGLKPAEITEAVLQCAVYAGFPRALQAMRVVRAVLDERGLLPVTD